MQTNPGKKGAKIFYFIIDVVRIIRLMKILRNVFETHHKGMTDYFVKFYNISIKRAKAVIKCTEKDTPLEIDQNRSFLDQNRRQTGDRKTVEKTEQ